MAIFDLFSKRQKRARGDIPDVYTYDTVPLAFRVQLVQILHSFTGEHPAEMGSYTDGYNATKSLVEIMRKERGVFVLPPAKRADDDQVIIELANYILFENDSELFIDVLEMVCILIEKFGPRLQDKETAEDAIEEINGRLKEHGLGYEYSGGDIVRIDSQLVHVEAVKPALTLLHDKQYEGPEQEFRSAFDQYRIGKTKEALTDALKAMESTMKVICAKRGWTIGGNGTARDLIQACYDNGLIPTFWQGHFGGLRSVLESGVPTARNRTSGHGQGATPSTVPDYLASYVLHMTAATIVFLVNAEKALP